MDDIPVLVPVEPEDFDEQVSRETPEHSPGHASTEECDELPRGKMLPLNSKRLVLPQLRALALMLGISAKATVAQTRQLIEGKLIELDREPRSVQVIVGEDSRLYLVDDAGVIRASEASAGTHSDHVPISSELSDHVPFNNELSDNDSETSSRNDSLEALRSALREARLENQRLQSQLSSRNDELERVCSERDQLNTDKAELTARLSEGSPVELERLRASVRSQTEKAKRFWRLRCEQMLEHDELIESKESEIASLRAQLVASRSRPVTVEPVQHDSGNEDAQQDVVIETVVSPRQLDTSTVQPARKGKAPPVDLFTGEGSDVLWEDWLPTLERTATWNNWTENEKLLQLAGHLRNKAAQEWTLLSIAEKSTFISATRALGARLDRGGKALAAQEFRHTVQRSSEAVSDFILRLEQIFRRAYGRENMSVETRDTLLYGQLQEGLSYTLVKSPAVSGARSYSELCLAARNEERRLAELHRRQLYQQQDSSSSTFLKRGGNRPSQERGTVTRPASGQRSTTVTNDKTKNKRCWNCDRTGHVAKECRVPKRESTGRSDNQTKTKMVQSKRDDNPLDYLLPDSSDSEDVSEVKQIRLVDQGSHPQHAKVVVGGVPMEGVVDSGSDITILGGEMFKRVATVAKLHKKDFKPPDKRPRTYNQQAFHIDGKIEVDVSFDNRTMKTAVYVKMDAPEQLLLSEGICRQLGILTYHPDVQPGNGDKKQPNVEPEKGSDCKVPMVRVRLIQDVRLLPNECTIATAELVGEDFPQLNQPLLFELDSLVRETTKIQAMETVVSPGKRVYIPMVNHLGFTQRIDRGMEVGTVEPIEIVNPAKGSDISAVPGDPDNDPVVCSVKMMNEASTESIAVERKRQLNKLFSQGCSLQGKNEKQLLSLLEEYHDVFSLEETERGETDWVEMNIDTGDATPIRQAPRRTPFAVRCEVARHLQQMQENGVIQPSSSPWASPIVLVRKKDGTMRFCIDYRKLNEVTKADKFPLPRIDDLLDQLGKAQYFSTLDLAAGYWQIRINEASKEKTAFTTQQGLFEFKVMPFGLTNAPAVFQRLMQKVISGLNPAEGPDFVCVYIDDLLIFSRSLEEHLDHLRLVMNRLRQAKLKLKPTKCHFVRHSVEFLGHIITSSGLSPNPKQVAAVQDFPVPQSIHQLRQYLGLTSYYRRFIGRFAKIAAPLYRLTKKEVKWEWSKECQLAFETLKDKLMQAPVLIYPDFKEKFVLETDASLRGLGAVLSQKKGGLLHPVSYASRSLSSPEKNYSISELETLAVVWAIQHYRAYLYGHEVTVVTDHSAVKAILETPSPSGKHARWWLKVFGSGVKHVEIKYRPGRENVKADSLSRNPVSQMEVEEDLDVQVAHVQTNPQLQITDLLEMTSTPPPEHMCEFHLEQQKDTRVKELYDYVASGIVPKDEQQAKKVCGQAIHFAVVDSILYFIDSKKQGRKRAVVPVHLQEQILKEYHGGVMAGHFSGDRLYKLASRHWWWETLYKDAVSYCRNCPECAIVSGVGRINRPLLHPIPVHRPFQIWGVDVMELPVTAKGNRYVIVFQDLFTKWPLVFAAPDQKAIRIAKLLAEELVPMFGCPECLLTDRGTNLLASVMKDVCKLMGVTKLNTTAYHPQCDGLVERMNRTLKAMLRKHTATFGKQWDTFLPGVLWAYRNMPHEATREKPSFLLFGLDCKSPTEAALLPPEHPEPVNMEDYREQLIVSLSSARKLAASSIQAAQVRYKKYYDKKSHPVKYQVGEWVLIRFPHEETGRQRKLSRPWHGPYRIAEENDPDVTVVKVYFPEEGTIQVHKNRVCPCPPQIPTGFYWYGGNRKSPGKIPKWLQRLLSEQGSVDSQCIDEEVSTDDHEEEDDNVGVEKQRYDLREREKIKCPTRS